MFPDFSFREISSETIMIKRLYLQSHCTVHFIRLDFIRRYLKDLILPNNVEPLNKINKAMKIAAITAVIPPERRFCLV